MNDDRRHDPAELDGNDKEKSEGFAGVARHLNTEVHPTRKRPISRQLVHKWWLHRSYNRFPEAIKTTGGGTGRPVFDLEAVTKWYISYRKHHGESLTIPTKTLPTATTLKHTGGEGTLAA